MRPKPQYFKEVGFMKRGIFRYLVFVLAIVFFAGCGPTTKGVVKDDVTLTGESEKLTEAGLKYSGPAYNVGIVHFENKGAKGGWKGFERHVTSILWTLVKQSGLEPVYISGQRLRERERLLELEQSGVMEEGMRSSAQKLESIDYQISGAITSYSEIEEGTDILIAKTKTQVARIQVDYGLTDVATGKSLLVESGMGEYRKTTGGFFGLGSKSTADPALRDGALRDALTKAMNKMIAKLNEQEFVSNVLAVEGNIVYIRAGEKSRFKKGTVFSVYRPGEKLIDPETGRAIGRRQSKVAEVVLTKHQSDRISLTKIKSGADIISGDVIRLSK